MTSLYEVLKAQKMGAAIAPDYFTALWAGATGGGGEQWETIEYTGAVPVEILAAGEPLIELLISGNMNQQGTPSPQSIIMPDECGDRTGNLWNEDYTGIDGNVKYVPVFVGEGTFTLSTDTPDYSRNAPLFLLSGNVSSGASTPVNGVYNGISRTTDSSNGYITIAFRRQSESSDSTTHKTMLNSGSSALPYSPYGFKLDISSGGKNLFDGTECPKTSMSNVGVWNYAADLTGSVYRIPCKPNTTYTLYLTQDVDITIWRIRDVSTDDVPTAQSTTVQTAQSHAESVPSNKSTTFTTSQNAKYILFQSNATAYSSILSCIMLIEGSTAKPYSPYNRTVTSVYLGEVETTRQIRKLVFDGTETWIKSGSYQGSFYAAKATKMLSEDYTAYCSHLTFTTLSQYTKGNFCFNGGITKNCNLWFNQFDSSTTVEELKSYLAQQYANGTPVCVWYVLSTPTTGIVNEPLRKIGTYADTISAEQAGVQIPTVEGSNVIDVETTLKPSEIYLKYKGRSNS